MLFKVIALAAALGVVNAQVQPTQVTVPATGKVTFSSQGYPGQYPNNHNEIFVVTGPVGKGIQFDAEAFNTEAGTFDTLSFSEVMNGVQTLLATFAGNTGPTKLVSTSNVVRVTFKTDSSVTNSGFLIGARVPVCSAGQNLCPGSETQCISSSQYCDDVSDCANGADEGPFCKVACGQAPVAPNLSAFRTLIAGFSPVAKSSGRIVGGTVARAHSWPWQVAMLRKNGGQICGGSILNSQWVMTAAHCCVAYAAVPSSYQIRVGAHNINAGPSTEPNAKTHDLSRLVVHPSYRARPVAHNDFCLLKVAEPIVFSEHVTPVCLPEGDGSDEAPGTKCWVTGWGSTSPARGDFESFIREVKAADTVKNVKLASRATPALYQVAVNITPQDVCSRAYPNYITPEMICGAAPGKDSCQGDSGGPFVCQKPAVNGVEQPFKLVGVVSWGSGCARPTHPGVYARTSTASNWIFQTLSS